MPRLIAEIPLPEVSYIQALPHRPILVNTPMLTFPNHKHFPLGQSWSKERWVGTAAAEHGPKVLHSSLLYSSIAESRKLCLESDKNFN